MAKVYYEGERAVVTQQLNANTLPECVAILSGSTKEAVPYTTNPARISWAGGFINEGDYIVLWDSGRLVGSISAKEFNDRFGEL